MRLQNTIWAGPYNFWITGQIIIILPPELLRFSTIFELMVYTNCRPQELMVYTIFTHLGP